MRLSSRSTLVASVLFFFSVAALLAAQHTAGGHHHPGAAKVKNPVAPSAVSLAAGKKLYLSHCSECHGETGRGDGEMGEDMDPKPANLSDAEWKHGTTDGEIFAVVRDGIKGTGMKSFAKKMSAHQIWDVINYVHTLASTPAKSH